MKDVNSSSGSGRRWLGGIAGLYGGFVLLMATCIIVAVQQDFHLVEQDYYQRELAYQERIDELNRTADLDSGPTIEYRPNVCQLSLHFPGSVDARELSGTISLYRPSNSEWDRTCELTVDSTLRQTLTLDSLAAGLWRVKVAWRTGGSSFYMEKDFFITD